MEIQAKEKRLKRRVSIGLKLIRIAII